MPGQFSFMVEYKVSSPLTGSNLLLRTIKLVREPPLPGRHERAISLPYVFNFNETSINVQLTLVDPESLKGRVSELEVRVETNNERFFSFFFALKCFFFAVAAVCATLFARRYYLQLKPTRVVEQDIIFNLGFLLLAYDFPLGFYLTSLAPSIPVLMLASLANVLIFAYILYFWLIVFEVLSSDFRCRPPPSEPRFPPEVEGSSGIFDRSRRLPRLHSRGFPLRQRPAERVRRCKTIGHQDISHRLHRSRARLRRLPPDLHLPRVHQLQPSIPSPQAALPLLTLFLLHLHGL